MRVPGSSALPFAALVLFSAACAPELVTTPTVLEKSSIVAPLRVVTALTVGESSAGYARTLPSRTRLEGAGRIAEGDVLRPLDITLTVEGASIHEAWVVVSGDRWIGFYLPVERRFSPLKSRVPLNLEP